MVDTPTPSPVNPQERPIQFKVIGDCLYKRDALPYKQELRVHDLGHGHIEATVMPRYGWSEVDLLSPTALADHEAAQTSVWDYAAGGWVPFKPTQQELLDKAARNLERSSRRAKTKVRRLCKAKQLTTMVTLTYRENITDRSRMARDFDVFMKRVRRAVPGFEYVCVFEKQKRGAWHAHIAVPRVLAHYMHKGYLVRSYDLLRSLWRGVVGVDGGNVDVSRQKRLKRSTARLASYLSKYITKGFAEASSSGDSYRASGKALPKPMVFSALAGDLGAGIAQLCELLGSEVASSREFYHALLDCGGYFLTLSP
jgi:hypothetical protein